MKVIFSDHAKRDLETIADWIASSSPMQALSFIAELRAECLNLVDFPERHPHFKIKNGRDIRRKVFGNYLIFYVVQDNTVAIVRIIHGAQDYRELF